MIETDISGSDEVVARLSGFPAALHDRLLATMERLGIALQAAVVAKLSGEVLQRRSGRLADAQHWRIDDAGDTIAISVGFDPDEVPYGAIQEYGGTTRAHLIAARHAQALAFTVGGRLAFAKHVNHPGSRIPARSFLRSALAEMTPAMNAAIAAELAP